MKQSEDFAQTFNALGDKTRFRLYKLLGEQTEFCVSQLAQQLTITPACVSQHMKILTEAGLVTRVRTGQRVCYEIVTHTQAQQAIHQLVFKS